MSLLDIVRGKIADAHMKRDAQQAELDAIVEAAEAEARDLNDDEAARFAAAKAAVVAADDELRDLRARESDLADVEARKAAAAAVRPAGVVPVGGAVVRAEERTYHAGNDRERSFFADAYNAQYNSDVVAAQRIQRHQQELSVERRDVTTGTFNGLVPPVYLLEQAAELARAMRPFADVIPSAPLPPNGMTMFVTRITTGADADVQSTQNTGATEVDMVTTDFTIPVVTILGQQDLSRQALERSSILDSMVMRDLLGAYAVRLDRQMFNGTGASGQHRGVLTVAGTNTVTYGSTSATTFLAKVAEAIAAVNGVRFAPASVIVMHPRRWGWLLASTDSTGRPLVQVTRNDGVGGLNSFGLGDAAAFGSVVGQVHGLPVITDANVPLVGASAIDNVIVTRLSDHFLAEGTIQAFRFEQAVNPPATIRLAIGGYSAATFERFAAATSVITGTGLVVPVY